MRKPITSVLYFLVMALICFSSCKKENSGSAPKCEFITPLDGAEIKAGTIAHIKIEASDSDGAIIELDFYINDSLKASFSKPHYDYAWNTKISIPGDHILKATCTDNDGNSAEATIKVKLIVF